MPQKSARNNELLKISKTTISPKIYSLLITLVNNDREDLAEMVLQIDSILTYTSTCVKQRDFKEAAESLVKAKSRIDMIKKEGFDTSYLDYLFEGIEKKTSRR